MATATAAARFELDLLTADIDFFALALAALLTLGLRTDLDFVPALTTTARLRSMILFCLGLGFSLPTRSCTSNLYAATALGMSSLLGPDSRLLVAFVDPLGAFLDRCDGLGLKASLRWAGAGADVGGSFEGEPHAAFTAPSAPSERGRADRPLVMTSIASCRDTSLDFLLDARGEFARLADAKAARRARGLSIEGRFLTRFSEGEAATATFSSDGAVQRVSRVSTLYQNFLFFPSWYLQTHGLSTDSCELGAGRTRALITRRGFRVSTDSCELGADRTRALTTRRGFRFFCTRRVRLFLLFRALATLGSSRLDMVDLTLRRRTFCFSFRLARLPIFNAPVERHTTDSLKLPLGGFFFLLEAIRANA